MAERNGYSNQYERVGRISRASRKRKKAAYRKSQQNLLSMLLVTLVVIAVIVVVSISTMGLRKKSAAYDARIAELQMQIDQENDRAQKIEEFRKYTQTKGFVEEVAQDKLGLVYDGEILFKQEK